MLKHKPPEKHSDTQVRWNHLTARKVRQTKETGLVPGSNPTGNESERQDELLLKLLLKLVETEALLELKLLELLKLRPKLLLKLLLELELLLELLMALLLERLETRPNRNGTHELCNPPLTCVSSSALRWRILLLPLPGGGPHCPKRPPRPFTMLGRRIRARQRRCRCFSSASSLQLMVSSARARWWRRLRRSPQDPLQHRLPSSSTSFCPSAAFEAGKPRQDFTSTKRPPVAKRKRYRRERSVEP